jgi:hypothetical protein
MNDPTRKAITLHDLRATGITWCAVRGDDALKIKQRAGHASFSTTEGYIREAETLATASAPSSRQGQLLTPLGSRFAVRLGAALEVTLVRSRFLYNDAGTLQQLFQRPPAAATGELGFVVTLR